MVLIQTYNFFSGNIPITVNIESDKNDFVLIYKVSISSISANTEVILEKIRDELVDKVKLGVADITDPKKVDYIRNKFKSTIIYLLDKYLPDISEETKNFLTTYLMQKSFGLGKIEILMSDPDLEEVVINNAEEPIWVYHHKLGWLKTNVYLKDEELIKHYSSLIGRKVGRSITLLTPLLDAHLETGDRVNATLYPISSRGNTITIRKFAVKTITIVDMINNGVISISSASLLWNSIQYELSCLITGGTATGKTSFLGAVCCFFPPNQRIISVEDTQEIKLPKYLHWIPMITRQANVEGKGEVTMLDLIVNSLRMRPDRIVVGEIRRKQEAETLFEAMHTGHSVYATLHANDTEETINRLTNPPIDVPKVLLPSISLIIVMYRNRRTGIRRIFQISEVLRDSKYNVLLQLDMRSDKLTAITKSQRLFPELELTTGLTHQEINENLREKGLVLRWMVKNNIKTVDEIGKVVGTYYVNKENLLRFVNK
ncbi:CpaF family protein [Candidatus Woesearchaeota archaeon]|nr:CpaF family protein [Candidatus Woesearchaeota archaeon]